MKASLQMASPRLPVSGPLNPRTLARICVGIVWNPGGSGSGWGQGRQITTPSFWPADTRSHAHPLLSQPSPHSTPSHS